MNATSRITRDPLVELLSDPAISLLGPFEAIRDDLRCKLAVYNEARVRRGLAPMSLTDVRPATHFGKQGVGA